jgi:hypothetical protein
MVRPAPFLAQGIGDEMIKRKKEWLVKMKNSDGKMFNIAVTIDWSRNKKEAGEIAIQTCLNTLGRTVSVVKIISFKQYDHGVRL